MTRTFCASYDTGGGRGRWPDLPAKSKLTQYGFKGRMGKHEWILKLADGRTGTGATADAALDDLTEGGLDAG